MRVPFASTGAAYSAFAISSSAITLTSDPTRSGSPTDTTSYTGVSPSFWTTFRLASIGTAATGGSSTRLYTLSHSYASSYGTWSMWLLNIQEAGTNGGGTLTMPAIRFDYVMLAQRFDLGNTFQRPRIWEVRDELGSDTQVLYGQPDVCSAATLPPNVQWYDNTRNCFPQYEAGGAYGGFAAYNKWLVTQVTVKDSTQAVSPDTVFAYTYTGGGAWRYNQNSLTPSARKSWNDWRGYGNVTVTKGASGTQTKTTFRFFRGMDGDYYPPSGTRSVSVTGLSTTCTAGTSFVDNDLYRGRVIDEARLSTSSTEIEGTRHWFTNGTATGAPAATHWVQAQKTERRLAIVGGGQKCYQKSSTFDSYGTVTQVRDDGDTSTTTDDRCFTRTPIVNTTQWIFGKTSSDALSACGGAQFTRTDYFYDGLAAGQVT